MIKMFDEFNNKHTFLEVFQDFICLSSISISNSIDLINYSRRENEYKKIISKYSDKDKHQLSKLFGELIKILEEKPCDALGELYMSLGLGNDKTGQFFTPYHLSELTAKIAFDKENIKKEIEEKGYVSLNEPTCGSAGMIIAFAECMKENGFNPQQELKVICQDLDTRCVNMSYIQLSLLGIPAVVLHCNTLSLEIFDRWITPFYRLKGFDYK